MCNMNRKTKHAPLIAYLVLVTLISSGFILAMKLLGQRGYYLAAIYMMGPAIAAFITRLFFYEHRFRDAGLRIGRISNYVRFWGISLGVSALSFLVYTLLGSISWDFTGQVFLDQLAEQFAAAGQNMDDIPGGLTPQMLLIIYFVGGLTIFNILPGIITGFGEEFGWRGLMFPQMYKIKPWVAFVIGGLIWYSWHISLVLVLPRADNFTDLEATANFVVLAICGMCTHAFLAYVFVKSESIFVASVAHITLNNAARSFAYFAIIQNQFAANIGLTITMMALVTALYISGETKVFSRKYGAD